MINEQSRRYIRISFTYKNLLYSSMFLLTALIGRIIMQMLVNVAFRQR